MTKEQYYTVKYFDELNLYKTNQPNKTPVIIKWEDVGLDNNGMPVNIQMTFEEAKEEVAHWLETEAIAFKSLKKEDYFSQPF